MTNEEMMQLKQLLEAMELRIDQKIADAEKRSTANMNVLIESMIQPQMNLLAENMELMEQRLNARMDKLEEQIDDRCDMLEATIRLHGREITKLKKAQ